MAGAANARLRAALEDYVRSEQGDTGSRRRGAVRSAQTSGKMVEAAQALLGGLGESQPAAGDTPGRRTAVAAGLSSDSDTSADRARGMLGGGERTEGPRAGI